MLLCSEHGAYNGFFIGDEWKSQPAKSAGRLGCPIGPTQNSAHAPHLDTARLAVKWLHKNYQRAHSDSAVSDNALTSLFVAAISRPAPTRSGKRENGPGTHGKDWLLFDEWQVKKGAKGG